MREVMSNINTKIFSEDELKFAVDLIRRGEIVAFPTETVYGLGADALNPIALKKIFEAKNRPQDNPLIVHVSSISQVEELSFVSDRARLVMDRFWPGPVAIILNKKSHVNDIVSAGLSTIAVRMPSNSVALDFISACNTPLAAPSANISGRPSSTSFEHVFNDLNGRVSGIIKSDESFIGVESSVIDLTVNPPVLLRPGGVSFEALKKVLPNLSLINKGVKNKSPGMKYKHYAPKAKIILFEGSVNLFDKKRELESQGFKVVVFELFNSLVCSRNLFNDFRKFDKEKVDFVLIKSISEEGIGLAIMNRVRKAAFKIVD